MSASPPVQTALAIPGAGGAAGSAPRRRRILVVALPHLAAEQAGRHQGDVPFAVVAPEGGALRLASVTPVAAAAGLGPGMGLSDARALCPGLVTAALDPARLGRFTQALARWAGQFSPLVGLAEGALVLDITGCAHLFGGEAALARAVLAALAARGLTARAGLADTKGAAWALAQSAHQSGAQSAHQGGAQGDGRTRAQDAWPLAIAAPGATRAAIGALPVGLLRIAPEAAEGLTRLGLGTIDLASRVPRGQIARRFGLETLRRLDQALGVEPEPVAPARAAPDFAVRLTLPEPVGLVSDVAAGLERLLARLCARLEAAQMGARRLALSLARVDGADQRVEIALARPMRDPVRLAALFAPKLAGVDAGFGIDALRLVVVEVEPLRPSQTGVADSRPGMAPDLTDLISRIGNRVGFDAVTRLLPAESHIPERAFTIAAAAWSEAGAWPRQGPPRPVTLFPPELLVPLAPGTPPARLRWGARTLELTRAEGPERIAPEWWWDDPAWRTGLRDYWRVATAQGPRLWLFHTPAAAHPDWFVQGEFA